MITFLPDNQPELRSVIFRTKEKNLLNEELAMKLHQDHKKNDVFYDNALLKWLRIEVRQRQEYLIRKEKYQSYMDQCAPPVLQSKKPGKQQETEN